MLLKDASIELRWSSGIRGGESPLPNPETTRATSPARNSPARRPHPDPHILGFGPIPNSPPKVRSPPICTILGGVLGSSPQEETRVENLEVEGGERDQGGERPEVAYPPLNQWAGTQHPSLSPNHQPPPTPKPRFHDLVRFLGYFHKSTEKASQKRRSYSQVVQSEAVGMAPPTHNRGGGRDGFGAGRHGRGAG